MPAPSCALCADDGGRVLWRDDRLRVVAVDDPLHPAFLRVIWREHVREMSDLAAGDSGHLLAVVARTERVLRDVLAPEKINLASFGNVVPHLHWHVIPRWQGDPHWPDPVWGVVRHRVARRLPVGWDADVAERLCTPDVLAVTKDDRR